MKNLILTVVITAFSTFSFAQSKYETAMAEKIAKMEQQPSLDDFQTLSNDFSRIAAAEKGEWLPYYYASFAQIQKGRMLMQEGKRAELDAIASEAQQYLDVALKLEKNNAELFILQKMIHSLKMMVNPMERFKTEGKLAEEFLAKAEKLDPQNPRITLLKAEDTFYTPEQFGGSRTKGIELFQKALEQFKIYKPKSSIHPNWGKNEAEYFLKSRS